MHSLRSAGRGFSMSDARKRKLSAKQIVSDIRAGMDATGVKCKYRLSDKALESVCRQLSEAGALTKQEMQRLTSEVEPSTPRTHEESRAHQWECPACHALQPSEMSECPDCGVIVAKFIALQGSASRDSVAVHPLRPAEKTVAGNSWAYVIVSIVALAIVGGAVVVWSMHRSNQKAKIAALDELKLRPSEQLSYQAGSSEEVSVDEQSTSLADSEAEVGTPAAETIDADQTGGLRPKPRASTMPPEPTLAIPERSSVETTKYVTGVLRQFTSNDFKKEVVEASKTLPVVFQFYSDT
jgi:hypothetical protein